MTAAAREEAPGSEPGGGRPRPAARRRHALWALPVAYMALIFYLSSQTAPLPELTFVVWDKLLHAIEYGGLGALLVVALRGSGAGSRSALAAGALLASAYGASDELHQWFVPGRDAEVLDWLADTVGGALGAIGASLALRVWLARASIRAMRART